MDNILDVILERAISVSNGEEIILPVRKTDVVDFYFTDVNEVEVQSFDSFMQRTDIATIAQEITKTINSVKEGLLNPLEIIVKCKAISDAMDLIKDEIMDNAITELRKYGKEQPTFFGARVSVIEAGARWDYSECESPTLDMATFKENEAKNEKKRVEDILKFMADKNLLEFLDNTGEVISIKKAPVKKSTTTIKVERPKLKLINANS